MRGRDIGAILRTLHKANTTLFYYWTKKLKTFERALEVLDVRWDITLTAYAMHKEVVFSGGVSGYKEWIPIDEAEIKYKYAPVLGRSVLPNEVVIDIDFEDKDQAKKTLDSLLEILTSYDIIPLICYSGRRGFHIHFFFEGVENPILFRKGFVDALFNIWDIDKSVCVKSRSLIREIYSLNPKSGYLKVPIADFHDYTFDNVPVENVDYRDWVFKIPEDLVELASKFSTEKKVKKEYTTKVDSPNIDKVLEMMKPYLVKEYDNYITYHCPFHPPDKHPSFVIFKPNPVKGYDFWFAIDYHTGEKYSMGKLYKKLKSLGEVKSHASNFEEKD